MRPAPRFLSPAEAARRLGVSPKALRLYEERGLISPVRTEAGWRAYGPDAMRRGAAIASLRALGFNLAQAGRVIAGQTGDLEPALAAHQVRIEDRIGQLAATVARLRDMRRDLAQGMAPALEELTRLARPEAEPVVAFPLPWPWGGETFELRGVQPITYITGPLGSGKTRLARRLAETLPDAGFLGLDRMEEGEAAPDILSRAGGELRTRIETALEWLRQDGAAASDALVALLASVEAATPTILVIDMVEQGLDAATQAALIAYLRRRGAVGKPLFLLTRSSAILDLPAVGAGEAIIFCPANHAPPVQVAPHPGAPGYEAVASCLASPEIRARTAGMIAVLPRAP